MKKQLFTTGNSTESIKSIKTKKYKRATNHYLEQYMRRKKLNNIKVEELILNIPFIIDTTKKFSSNNEKEIDTENKNESIIELPLFMKEKKNLSKNLLMF